MAKKKSKVRLYVILGIILIVIIAGIAIAVSMNKNKPISVTTSKVERRTITQTVTAIGTIEPETKVKISSENSGEIVFLGVKEGDTVSNNQLLVRIKPDIIETQLEQYQAAVDASKTDIEVYKVELARLEADLKRMTDLYKKEYISHQEFDKAKASFETAQSNYQSSLARHQQSVAALKQIKVSAMRTTIFSPINGIVTALSVEKGEKVVGTAQMAGTEMMVISDLNTMNAVVEVDENDIVLVKIGDTASVEIDALPNKTYKGVVVEIGHSAQSSSLGTQDQVTNFKVKVRILDIEGKLRPGMSCNVDISTETKHNVIAIPLQSVTIRDTKLNTAPDIQQGGRINKVNNETKEEKGNNIPSVVFIKEGKIAKMVNVTTGISDKGYIEIISGLKENTEIISGSYQAISKQLQDGIEVVVDTNSKKIKMPNIK